MVEDRFGLPLTTTAAAAEAYVEGVDLLFAMQPGGAAAIDEALAIDPRFALAHVARSRLCQVAGDAPTARDAMARAVECVADATPRERGHVEISALAMDGKGTEALKRIDVHVRAYPRDAVPLSLALGVYGLLGFSGRLNHHQDQLTLLERLAPAWGEDWWFSAAHGWAEVENGRLDAGIDRLERALALNPQSAHAAHGRAHGYYERGEPDVGRAFLDRWLRDYDRSSPLHCHLSWHAALGALHLGDRAEAMDRYEAYIRPGASRAVPMFTLIDAASFVWRLHLGRPAGEKSLPRDRLEELHAYARAHFPHAALAFVNLHNAMALALNDDVEALGRLAAECERLAGDMRPAARVVALVVDAITAFQDTDYPRAAARLATALPQLDRVGGSHAQRDVVVDSLIAAYLRADAPEDAARLMAERSARRAPHLDAAWLRHLAR